MLRIRCWRLACALILFFWFGLASASNFESRLVNDLFTTFELQEVECPSTNHETLEVCADISRYNIEYVTTFLDVTGYAYEMVYISYWEQLGPGTYRRAWAYIDDNNERWATHFLIDGYTLRVLFMPLELSIYADGSGLR